MPRRFHPGRGPGRRLKATTAATEVAETAVTRAVIFSRRLPLWRPPDLVYLNLLVTTLAVTADPVIPSQYDRPKPQQIRRDTQPLGMPTVLVDTRPAQYVESALPRRAARPADVIQGSPASLLELVAAMDPVFPIDLGRYRTSARTVQDLLGSPRVLFDSVAQDPVFPADWGAKRAIRLRGFEVQGSPVALLGEPAPAPVVPTDFGRRATTAWRAQDHLQGTPLVLLDVVQPPVIPYDFTRPVRAYFRLETAPQNILVTTLSLPPDPLPFNQYDWPAPHREPYRVERLSWVNYPTGLMPDSVPPEPVIDVPLGPWGPGAKSGTPQHSRSMFHDSHRPQRKKKHEPEPELPAEAVPSPPAVYIAPDEPAPWVVSLTELLDLQTRLDLTARKALLAKAAQDDHEALTMILAMLAMMDD